jgi:hypothetical protein
VASTDMGKAGVVLVRYSRDIPRVRRLNLKSGIAKMYLLYIACVRRLYLASLVTVVAPPIYTGLILFPSVFRRVGLSLYN